MKPILQIIVTTTRPARKGPILAKWLYQYAKEQGNFEVELVDIADFNLPMFDEPNHPRLQDYVHTHTKKWSSVIDRADAFIFVIPEYDHLPPSSFINAITYLNTEWNYKAAAFMSYGGVSGGLRAVETARQLANAVRMVPILDTIPVPHYGQYIDENEVFVANELIKKSADAVLSELLKMDNGLSVIRQKQNK